MSRIPDDRWTPPRGSLAGAALEAWDAYQHLRAIDLRTITDIRLRAQVKDAREVARRTYQILWYYPPTRAARNAFYDTVRASLETKT